jgi:hypothetical protein
MAMRIGAGQPHKWRFLCAPRTDGITLRFIFLIFYGPLRWLSERFPPYQESHTEMKKYILKAV